MPVRLLAYCLMPNHFHLVVWPPIDGQTVAFHVLVDHDAQQALARYPRARAAPGHVYQGRFKAIPVQSDTHFLRLCRYVERNPLRAGLVARAEEWPWSSLRKLRNARRPVRLTPWPVLQT